MSGQEESASTLSNIFVSQNLVRTMLGEIRDGGEEVCKAYAEKLDNYTGPILLTEEEIQEQIKDIPDQVAVEEKNRKMQRSNPILTTGQG